VPNNRSSEPWNGHLLGLMEHNGSRKHLDIIIGRIVIRRIHELREKTWQSRRPTSENAMVVKMYLTNSGHANGQTSCVWHTGSPKSSLPWSPLPPH
jgi:hypothetical protein